MTWYFTTDVYTDIIVNLNFNVMQINWEQYYYHGRVYIKMTECSPDHWG